VRRATFPRLVAISQALLVLSLSACASTKPAMPAASDFKVTVKAEEPSTAAAPTAAAPAKSPETPAPAAPTSSAGGAPQTAPVPIFPPGLFPMPKAIVSPPGKPAHILSSSQPDSGQPVVRLRQSQTGPAAGQPAAQSPGRLVVFNFDNADIEIVLQATSELLVFNYVLAPGARGKKVTVQTTGRIPVDDIFPVLLTILDVNGLAAVKSGNLWRIIPKEGAAQTSTRTVVGGQLDAGVPGDEVITQIVPLQFTSATDVMTLLRPFVPPQGGLTATRDTNLLVITDVAGNIRRLLDILKLVDVDVALSELRIIALKHADAQEVAQLLTQLFASGRFSPATPQLPAGVTPPAAVPAAPGARPAVPAATAPRSDQPSTAERAPLIVPERRSNSLVIYARKQEMDTIGRLIEKLDADIYGGQRVYFYFAENTKAKDLAATLDAIFGRGTGASTTTPTTRPPTTTGAPGLPSQSTVQATTRAPVAGAAGARGPGFLEEGGAAAETRFIADEVTNSVIVTTYPRIWTEVEEMIKKLDRMPRQVLIEVLAAEVTLDDKTSLGLQWALQHGRFSGSFSDSGTLQSRPPDLIPPFGITGLSPGLNFFTFAANEFMLAINALATENKVNVLSSPSIMTAENKKAVINVSRSVPILTSQQVPIGATPSTGTTSSIVGTQTVEYKDAGIILTVTPRIGEQGTVALDVKQEVNDVGDPVPPTNSPEFRKREAETSVVLLNNQTLVLGGLIQNRRSIVRTGIPFLNKIPVFGYLFGNTSDQVTKTELILLITPRVVGTALDAARITEQIRNLTPELRDSVKQKQFPYPSYQQAPAP
jgi:general secretion pathway protein D